MSTPAAGGGRWVSVAPERIERWLDGFRERHDGATITPGADVVTVMGDDGALAECHVPFPPLHVDPGAADGGLVAHALARRRVGVLLVRLGGYAAGVFEGTSLVASKVGSRPVHGRSAAGGSSQHRFARRREGQSRVALAAAADTAAAILLPVAPDLDVVVVGGDRRAVATVLDDPRLAVLGALVAGPLLDVPDPRQRVLEQTPAMFRSVRVRLVEPDTGDQP